MEFKHLNDWKIFTCFWRIENISLFISNDTLFLISETFDDVVCGNALWHLEIRKENKDGFRVYLYIDEQAHLTKINFSISVLTKKAYIKTIEDKWQTFDVTELCFGTGKLIKWDDIVSKNSENDTSLSLTIGVVISKKSRTRLTAVCFLNSRIVSETDVVHTSKVFCNSYNFRERVSLDFPAHLLALETEPSLPICDENSPTSVDDLLSFFRDKKFTFVTLRAGGTDFLVHKELLSAQSPVFNAMFESNLRKNKNNIVAIDDVESDTLSLLLELIHFEPLDSVKWEDAIKLYHAVDKYQFLHAKRNCVSMLKSGLTLKNLFQTLILADTHQDEELKTCTYDFFHKNRKETISSKPWKEFKLKRPDLAFDILESL